jgi:hypothetical protein
VAISTFCLNKVAAVASLLATESAATSTREYSIQ